MNEGTIYAHNEAADILELFELVLDKANIRVPSPEDDEREEDNEAKLYGSVYSDLLDEVEERLVDILSRHGKDTRVISWEFS